MDKEQTITRRFMLGGIAATVAMPLAKSSAVAAIEAKPDFLPCFGQSVSRTDYPDLFKVVGEIYGASDETTFNLPNFREGCHVSITPVIATGVRPQTSLIEGDIRSQFPTGFIAFVANKDFIP